MIVAKDNDRNAIAGYGRIRSLRESARFLLERRKRRQLSEQRKSFERRSRTLPYGDSAIPIALPAGNVIAVAGVTAFPYLPDAKIKSLPFEFGPLPASIT